MEEKAITVMIADRPYRLTIDKEEEEVVQKAVKLIDQKTKEYSRNYAFQDKQDLLAMITLQFTTTLLNEEDKNKKTPDDLVNRLTAIDDVLTGILNEK
jgi:cell division protein ZapA (FtsZ GTPase activity inhibitor)